MAAREEANTSYEDNHYRRIGRQRESRIKALKGKTAKRDRLLKYSFDLAQTA
jgi:hypothetical protein